MFAGFGCHNGAIKGFAHSTGPVTSDACTIHQAISYFFIPTFTSIYLVIISVAGRYNFAAIQQILSVWELGHGGRKTLGNISGELHIFKAI